LQTSKFGPEVPNDEAGIEPDSRATSVMENLAKHEVSTENACKYINKNIQNDLSKSNPHDQNHVSYNWPAASAPLMLEQHPEYLKGS